jgi:hypothetical protein
MKAASVRPFATASTKCRQRVSVDGCSGRDGRQMETHHSVLVGRIAKTFCGDPPSDAGHFAKGAHTATARTGERRNCAATSDRRTAGSRLLFVNGLRPIAVAPDREHPTLGQESYRAIYRLSCSGVLHFVRLAHTSIKAILHAVRALR